MGSTATYMLRRHQRTIEAAGRPEAIAERLAHNKANEKAIEERENAYPEITPENFEEAASFYCERLDFWKRKA